MTTVVHTADVHLDQDRPERMEGLRSVMQAAADSDAELLTIGGDLFDTPDDFEALRNTLRNEVFTENAVPTLLIPGNHDEDAFRGNLDFGPTCSVVVDHPFGTWTSDDGDVRIIAVPYVDRLVSDHRLALADRDPFDGLDVLMIHGSLDAPGAAPGAGEEAGRAYCPLSSALLERLGFDVYLAGHYHSPQIHAIGGGGEFVYPGTPVSTRRSETGRRKVCRIDADGVSLDPVGTPHYAQFDRTIIPGQEEEVFADLDGWVDAQHEEAVLMGTIDGFTQLAESEVADRLGQVPWHELRNDVRGAEQLLEDPLYGRFRDVLREQQWDEPTTTAVDQLVLEVMGAIRSMGDR
jgi:DNA repair exonuclease SbcCD nuclease subunit